MSDNLSTILEMLPSLTARQLSDLQAEVRRHQAAQLKQHGIDGTLTEDERASIDRGDVYAVVCSIRERTGLGLRQAKDYMDRARGPSR